MAADGKIPMDGGPAFGQNPFGALSAAGLPAGKPGSTVAGAGGPGPISSLGAKANQGSGSATPVTPAPPKNRGRVDITRETGGRGGKTVTVVSGFTGIGLPEKEALAKKMRGTCGCGGTVKDGTIVIQGDQRETVARILSEAGFRPVFVGG